MDLVTVTTGGAKNCKEYYSICRAARRDWRRVVSDYAQTGSATISGPGSNTLDDGGR
jgi:hypothetical protein